MDQLHEHNGNGHACAGSRYQGVSLLPSGLGMRLAINHSGEIIASQFGLVQQGALVFTDLL